MYNDNIIIIKKDSRAYSTEQILEIIEIHKKKKLQKASKQNVHGMSLSHNEKIFRKIYTFHEKLYKSTIPNSPVYSNTSY